ncbi:hypothetical protein H3Z85_05510 [Chryseobacterium indologenes]|uniref:Right-handed parallel beta-helix repeat-containing protein n=1 Tax=Chryseobacterium indologenes TaxID=253 RepID=A0AAD0YUL1_CHRID|nr:hypothetical protein [Chryseobacterium indologenes]ATN06859.1 hypothetical protein CRN76_16305 [Chryseobacterium indologenes]AYY84395.1 hypothetical protein EGX91_07490 [Chryseobacterium indologenes]AYZ34152.1 hypothetical protein EGY07_00550 [Chryseobacterium indologenes]AZB18645.1 hypothetical protein EG352_13070 [Chryseobacterium indologenes]MBF6642671.1 hypothetical protein [Chryseobacterium indologenes]
MKFKLLLAFCFWILLVTVSCNKDDITFDAPSQQLRFSRDTVFCDTVYHQVRSETYVVKVYNNEDKDILIPRVNLEQGAASLYRINVDGKPGYDFKDVPLRKKDSLYIFVEISPQATGPEAIAEDKVIFSGPAGQQHVTLFSVVQDAEFYIQTPTNPNVITSSTTWSNNKAKIIYGNLTVNPNVTLDVDPGTKIYFHKNSGMKVASGGVLNINGTMDQQVIIRGDRNDTKYDTVPKNWNSIKMEPNSILNMNHARLFGGIKGLEMKQTTATITNSFIHTFLDYGIYAVGSTVRANNLVMNNCGLSCIGIFRGGNHSYTHATIANYSKSMSQFDRNGIFATNEWKNDAGQIEQGALQQLSIKNSIVYSDRDNSVQVEPTSGQQFEFLIQNCLIKYSGKSESGYTFDNSQNVVQSIKNEDPQFVNYFMAKMNLRLKSTSPAKGKGNVAVAGTVPVDIVNVSRTTNPTLGAYQ